MEPTRTLEHPVVQWNSQNVSTTRDKTDPITLLGPRILTEVKPIESPTAQNSKPSNNTANNLNSGAALGRYHHTAFRIHSLVDLCLPGAVGSQSLSFFLLGFLVAVRLQHTIPLNPNLLNSQSLYMTVFLDSLVLS